MDNVDTMHDMLLSDISAFALFVACCLLLMIIAHCSITAFNFSPFKLEANLSFRLIKDISSQLRL